MDKLAAHPALWLLITLAVYAAADALFTRFSRPSLLNPVFVTTSVLIGLLVVSGVSYSDYFNSVRFLHLLLGPATVALAIPLYSNLSKVRAMLGPLLLALLAGSLIGMVSALLLAKALGLPAGVMLSLAPKSVTTPIAMALADRLGGYASLAAAGVLLTGVFGAMVAAPVMKFLNIKEDAVKGFALGLSAHGAGTAQAFYISPAAGAFSGLAMGLNGVLTSLLLPLLVLAL